MAKSDKTQNNGWGGSWTEEKLDCFEKYVKAYLTIMNNFRDKFNWKLIYFDGFAGCGDRERKKEGEAKSQALFGEESIEVEDMNVYQGAAERVVRLEKQMRGFDFYYFIDKYEDNITRLMLKLSQYDTKGRKCYRCSDANEQALMLSQTLREKSGKYKCLCLLDPFGMTIDWNTIVALAGKSIDLWILVPTGSIVSRLVKNNGELRFPEKLESFFGLPENDIKNRLYVKKTSNGLFGEIEEVQKVKSIVQEIANLYCDQLGTLFPYVTNTPLVLYNSKNVPIFHFVCASYNSTAVKIAKNIIDKQQKR